ncbi:hypothetical protein Afil01_00030 [Actinorhabdospora filicis]|uniref:Alpha/beta hydrolase fold-3 domain-containing protein n=1 Tax=Actinorhabdospora filicis TaxID=1785913 RepID=A0A9W6SGX0_9ACTN|nr:alpha/beta hydrolase [Actinorhabdospora filicis]GLZ75196.1 hypothetical protein Afil01_00030 [Actinorhabdospora filicis]
MSHAFADDALAAFVAEAGAQGGPTFRERGAADVRAGAAAVVRPREPELFEVRDVDAGGVAARLYRPSAGASRVLVYLHGGMWSIGSLETHDRACRALARDAGVSVLAVDYRLAPEHPFPAAVEDAVAVFGWATRLDARPGIGGDSAGGHLAALASIVLRDGGGPLPSALVMAYPNTDLTFSRPSTREKAEGWGLTTDAVMWGAEQWVPDPATRADPRVSPLFAGLAGLPPAVVVTAEHDPLRDEGEEFAARLGEAGVPVVLRREEGMIHGFLTLHGVSPAVESATARFAADVARVFGNSDTLAV